MHSKRDIPFKQISIAPMMDWTDRHDRYFLRLISKNVLLYTEMITTSALLHGDPERLLAFHPAEHPIVIQLGGCVPAELAQAAKIAETYGYDAINLNVGCPSPRVQKATFGAALMAHPQLVRDNIRAMQDAVSIPVTVKTRIGIDHSDDLLFLIDFIGTVAESGCQTFIIHARKAWLSGLSPKENREIPPLRYDIVAEVKKHFSHLSFILNGGIKTHEEIQTHLQTFDGVMLGRIAYHDPYFLASVDQRYFGSTTPIRTREEIIETFIPYVETQLKLGVPLQSMTRHILGLYHGESNARAWRRLLSEQARLPGAGIEILQKAQSLFRL